MTKQNNSQQGIRFLVTVAALVIIIVGINQAQSVLVAFLVAVFLAMLGTPPVLWLERKRIPSVVAVLLGGRHDRHPADRRRNRRRVSQQFLY
jgi:predicted PurR-regulated permease PerM